MPRDTSVATLQDQIRDVWLAPGWQDFRRWRPIWSNVRERRENPQNAVLLERFGIDATSMSPLLEYDLQQHVAVQISNAAKIDMLSLDTGDKAKERVEDMRIYAAARWLQEDEGRQFSKELFEWMDTMGIAYAYKTWSMPQEPKPSDKADDEDTDAYEKRRTKERGDYYSKRKPEENFGRERINPLEMAHFPTPKPTLFLQVSEIPYVYARKLRQYRLPDKPFRLMRNSGEFHWGETEPTDDLEIAREEWSHKKVKRIRRAEWDEDEGCWYVAEWLCEGNELTGALANAEILDEYEAPFCPYFVVESGPSTSTETNPHLRYRPKNYPMTVKVQELNMWRTAFLQYSLWRLQNPYLVTFQGVDPQALDRWVEANKAVGLAVAEGAGAEQSYYLRVPDTPMDGIPVLPRIEAPPEQDAKYMLDNIVMLQQEIQEFRANRYLIGNGPTGGETATQTLAQAEAAGTTYGPDLTNMSLFIERWIKGEFDAICRWSKNSKKTGMKEITVHVRGDEPTGGYERDRETGEIVVITADKIQAQEYVVLVSISNETNADRFLREQQAARKFFEWNASTREQFLKDVGWDDPRKQLELLEKERTEQAEQPYWDDIRLQNRRKIFALLTGLNPALLPPTPGEVAGAPMGSGTPQGTAGETPGSGVFSGTAPSVQGPQGTSGAISGALG